MRVLFGQRAAFCCMTVCTCRVCCVYINVVVVFSSDLGIFEYFNIRILGRYIRTNSKTMLAALAEWYHISCENIPKAVFKNSGTFWICSKCVQKNVKFCVCVCV